MGYVPFTLHAADGAVAAMLLFFQRSEPPAPLLRAAWQGLPIGPGTAGAGNLQRIVRVCVEAQFRSPALRARTAARPGPGTAAGLAWLRRWWPGYGSACALRLRGDRGSARPCCPLVRARLGRDPIPAPPPLSEGSVRARPHPGPTAPR